MNPKLLMRPIRRWPVPSDFARRVTWLELFFDLIFVAAVAQIGDPLRHEFSLQGLLRYALMFFLIWWAWLGHTMFYTRFESDDAVQRLLTLLQIFAAAAMAANAKGAIGGRDFAGFGAAYAVVRLVLVAQYLRARRIPETRSLTTNYAIGFGIAAALFLIAAMTPFPASAWVWAAALAFDFGTPSVATHLVHKFPPAAGHLPERFGLFTIILLGESMAAVMHGMESQEAWPPSAAIAAFFGLSLAFGYWWWYFDCAGGADERHVRSKKDLFSFHLWSYSHVLLYLSIAVTGIGVQRIISLPPGANLNSEEASILIAGATALMLSMNVIAHTAESGKIIGRRRARRLALFAISCAALPLEFASSVIPPHLIVVYLTVLCAVSVTVASQDKTETNVNRTFKEEISIEIGPLEESRTAGSDDRAASRRRSGPLRHQPGRRQERGDQHQLETPSSCEEGNRRLTARRMRSERDCLAP